jgi:D-alanyl-D-alanine carboxypeptidase (penicillin-binding protein 5/6)
VNIAVIFKKIFLFICLFVIFLSTSLCYADDIDTSGDFEFTSTEVSSINTSTPDINSRAAVILEKSTGTILLGKNEHAIRKMASTTKIMTAIIVLENIENLSDTVIVSKKAANIGGSRLGLSANAKITVNDLLYGLLLCSGNDSAIALAEFISGSVEEFANLMNQKALDLGLKDTHFVTPHGLDNEEHYTTAYELAILTKYALENKRFSKVVSTHNYTVSINGSSKNINNTNELLGSLSGVYGVKTGFTNGANRCLVTACKRGDLDIICVVLGADTKKFRTQDSIKLIEYAFSNFEMIDINSMIKQKFSEWQHLYSNKFIINKGISNSVQTYYEEFPYCNFPINKSNIKDIEIKINCSYEFNSPLLENTLIGNICGSVKDTDIFKLNIYTKKAIPKKYTLFYINSFFKNYCVYIESLFF